MELQIKRHGVDIREYTVVSQQPLITPVDVLCACSFLATLSVQFGQLIGGGGVVIDRWLCVTLASVVYCVVSKRYIVREESILVMAELGLQLRTTYAMGGGSKIVFIDKQRLNSVIINEGITMCRVMFYLAFVVRQHPQPQPQPLPLPVAPAPAVRTVHVTTAIAAPLSNGSGSTATGSGGGGFRSANSSKSKLKSSKSKSTAQHSQPSQQQSIASAPATPVLAATKDTPLLTGASGSAASIPSIAVGGVAVSPPPVAPPPAPEEMVLAFQHFFPRLQMLLVIYRGVRHVIYGEPEPVEPTDTSASSATGSDKGSRDFTSDVSGYSGSGSGADSGEDDSYDRERSSKRSIKRSSAINRTLMHSSTQPTATSAAADSAPNHSILSSGKHARNEHRDPF